MRSESTFPGSIPPPILLMLPILPLAASKQVTTCFSRSAAFGKGKDQRAEGPRTSKSGPRYSLQQGAAVCPSGMTGWSRTVRMQLQDQYANPVQVSGIVMADQIFVGTPNDLHVGNTNTGSHPTDAYGTWPDTYFVCSPYCPGSTGESDAIQSWTWDALGLPHSNVVVYRCSSITVDGR